MKKYQVVFCYELGARKIVDAKNAKDAERIVNNMLDVDGIGESSERLGFETVARDYWINEIEEVKI